MLYKSHNIQLVVNGQSVDIKSQQGFSLAINNSLFDPKKLSSTQAEYSYSFTLPATPTNNKIFNFANCLDKSNRFHQRWKAELYADEQLIFSGTLIINSYKDKEYGCNLVSPKVYNLEDIFGDAKLTDIPWSATPFNGISTINEYNAGGNKEVMFPLVSYGVFEKVPYNSDEVANDYTDKFVFDKYNRWWTESFYPSLNMLTTVKKAFEWKGYEVAGDAFSDTELNSIYMSTNLADGQVPTYNLANPLFGEVDLTTSLTTSGSGYEQELNFPYFHLVNGRAGFGSGNNPVNTKTYEEWNFNSVRIYDLLKNGSTTLQNSYMYDPNEKCIVIPADGWYMIYMNAETQLNTATTTITASQYCITDNGKGDDIESKDFTMTIGLDEVTPVEIQLVRNYDDNIEIIKGKWNKQYVIGDPTVDRYEQGNNRWYNNITEWRTAFPHEDLYNCKSPTKTNDLSLRNTQSQFGGNRTTSDSLGSTITTRGGSRSGGSNGGFGSGRTGNKSDRVYNSTMYGYVPVDMQLMCYDPAVNSDFICGFSSIGKGQPSVIKNGYSWTKSYADKMEAFYNQPGYMKLVRGTNDTIEEVATNFNQNEYSGTPTETFFMGSVISDGKRIANGMYGSLYTLVWLNKNDILELFEVHRAYNTTAGTDVNYSTNTNVRLKIKAMSPNSMAHLINEGFNYGSESEFDTGLRLSNFMNKETNISSFIQDILTAFNLQMTQEGKTITIDKRKNPLNNEYLPVIDLDDRANSIAASSENIEFPSSLAVKYKIDTEEWGYETTVPAEKLNDEDWAEYGDSGYTVLKISDDDYNVDNQEINLNFSYTWYDDFTWTEVDSGGTENSGNTLSLSIPVISKFTYMVPRYDYDECLKHDGFGLTQRFWLKPEKTDAFVWTASYPTEKVDIYIPKNSNDNIVLNYKDEENSLLMKYFNANQNVTSDKITLEVYISIDEYNLIKNGARVKFDKTVYIPTEIVYYPSGETPAKLTLMKL